MPSLAALRESLANSGLDAFVIELQIQNPILGTRISSADSTRTEAAFGVLKSQANVFKNKLFEYSTTPNPDLTSLLNSGLVLATNASSDAGKAEKLPSESALGDVAIASARALYDANLILYTAIQASRLNIDGNEISFRAELLNAALAEFSAKLDADSGLALTSSLEGGALVARITTTSSNVIAARTSATTTLDQALTAARAASDPALAQSTSTTALARLNTLAGAMLNNGDNIAVETLKSAAALLTSATQSAPTTLTAANALRIPVKDVIYWADASADQAANITRLAQKSTWASVDSDTSAYTAARKLLASLDGETGTTSTLEAYIKSPGDAARQAAAQAALAV